MEKSISARHGQLNDSDHGYIDKKLPKLAHLFDRLTSIRVMVDLEKLTQPMVEILVSAEHKHDFVATESHETVTAAFDNAMDKMETQIRRYKKKIQDHHRKASGFEDDTVATSDNE